MLGYVWGLARFLRVKGIGERETRLLVLVFLALMWSKNFFHHLCMDLSLPAMETNKLG